MQRVIHQESPVYDTQAIKFLSIYELRQLMKYRFLVQNMISRDLKVRYKRSALGFIWVMLNPLLTMIVTTYIFSQILKNNIPHFPTYALAGLLLFNVLSQGSVAAMSSLTSNGPVLSRLYIPPSVFVISSIGSALVNFFYALVPLALIAILVDRLIPNLFWLLSIIPFAEMAIFTLGIGLMVSALTVYFHDTFEIYTVIISLLGFATPLFYSINLVSSPQFKAIEGYNPVYVFVDTFRVILIDSKLPDAHELLLGSGFALVTFIAGWLIFTRLERNFAYQF